MTTQNTYVSKIATLVYAQYTENVDMNLEWFKQSELTDLFNSDKSILRVDYYENGVLVDSDTRPEVTPVAAVAPKAEPVVKKEITYTPKQAAMQIMKMNASIAKLYDKEYPEYGSDWFINRQKNETLRKRIGELEEKMVKYKPFLTEEVFYEYCGDLCISWEEYMYEYLN